VNLISVGGLVGAMVGMQTTAPSEAADDGRSHGSGAHASQKSKDVRRSNISAAKAVADAVRTSLGPRGMDKMVQSAQGDVIITNDGATILEQMHVEHPAAKMLVQLSKAQDVVAGDGTTSVVVICGALLSASLDLLARGIHPSSISDAFAIALDRALKIVHDMSTPISLDDRASLLKAASTSLLSKVVSQHAAELAKIAVDAVLRVRIPVSPSHRGPAAASSSSSQSAVSVSSAPGVVPGAVSAKSTPAIASSEKTTAAPTGSVAGGAIAGIDNVNLNSRGTFVPGAESTVDLKNIRTVKKLGGTIDDTEMVDGLILNQEAARGGSASVSRVEKAKVALIQFCLSPPKTDVENSVIVQDYTAMDRILREERQYLLNQCKKIKATGCNVLLIQKSILRDSTTELSLHFLAKLKIMAVTDIERDEVEFISKSLGCIPIAGIETFTADKLAKVDLVEEVELGPAKMVKLTGIANSPRVTPTVSILIRGSNQLLLDEAERSLHDALCVIRSIVHKQYLLPGGGAPETEVSVCLARQAKSLTGLEAYCLAAYADALDVVPFTLAENAGLNPVDIVTELRRCHAAGESGAGINVRSGSVTNIAEENVVMPQLVFTSALSLATECVRQLLKIDDIILVR
jgi:T-complex protein 1 subunit delta